MESLQIETETPHVFENPVILKRIFRYLPPPSVQLLKHVRLVSQIWHRESLSLWRKSAMLLLHETPLFTAQEFQGMSPSRYWEELQNPESLYQLKEKPFHKYKFQKLTIDLSFCSYGAKANAFWSTVGPQMRQLTLRNVNFDLLCYKKYYCDKILMRWICSTLPNLEALLMENVFCNTRLGPPDGDLEIDRLFHRKLKQLSLFGYSVDMQVGHFPNLEQLTLSGGLEYTLCYLYTSDEVRERPTLLENVTIKRLDVINCVDVHCSIPLRFPVLEHLAVDVSSFRIHYNDINLDPAILIDLLRSSTGTLRTLEMFHRLSVFVPPTTAPLFPEIFPQLAELKICGNVVWDLNFLRLMPLLRLLHLDYYGVTKRDMMRRKDSRKFIYYDIPHNNNTLLLIPEDPVQRTVQTGLMTGVVLEKLESLYINYSLEPESVRVLGNWMPSLKKLEGVFKGETLKIVGKVFKEYLEELRCLYRSKIEDTDILELKGMKKLKRFYYDAECDGSQLTDNCMTEGFLQMPGLADLQICVSDKFSEAAEAALKERVENVRVNRNYGTNPDHEDWNCCEDTAYLRCVFEERSFVRRRPRESSHSYP